MGDLHHTDARVNGDQMPSTAVCIEAVAHYRAVNGHSQATTNLDTWILTAIGVSPQRATLLDLERVIMHTKNKGSRATYAKRIRSCFTVLRKVGLITNTADEDLPHLRAPATRPRPLTDDQVARLLERLEGTHLDIFRIGILAGTRSMEVFAMAGADLSDGLHGPELLLHGKGGKEETVPAHPAVVEIIESYQTLGRIFTRWCSPRGLSQAMGTAMRHALDDQSIEYHQCRHTFGTRVMTASGNDLLLTSTLLRHSSLASTQIYVKLVDDRPRMAINQLAG